MSRFVNKIIMTGRLAAAPEPETPHYLRLAIEDEESRYHVRVHGERLVAPCVAHMQEGSKVYVEGRLLECGEILAQSLIWLGEDKPL